MFGFLITYLPSILETNNNLVCNQNHKVLYFRRWSVVSERGKFLKTHLQSCQMQLVLKCDASKPHLSLIVSFLGEPR